MVVRTLHQLTIVCALAAGCSKREPAPSGNAPSTGSAPAAPAAPAAPTRTEPLKIAFAYVGPVGDAGWTFAHNKARQAVEAEFAGKVTTSFVENVPEAADAERVIRDMVSQGAGLVFGTTFGYMEPMLKVAADAKQV
ncbi:MAG TPA: BMP family ABC transporter substrate-binding protein, partial [Kofleriaceae bacterium]